MDKIVLDTSVIVKWFSNEEDKELANRLLLKLQNSSISVYCPELVKYEFGNSLINKKFNLGEMREALLKFYQLPIIFVSDDEEMAISAEEIAVENKITFYDASFVALAKKFKVTLVTANPKHQKVKSVKVVELSKY